MVHPYIVKPNYLESKDQETILSSPEPDVSNGGNLECFSYRLVWGGKIDRKIDRRGCYVASASFITQTLQVEIISV
jgi:hypothetical protein